MTFQRLAFPNHARLVPAFPVVQRVELQTKRDKDADSKEGASLYGSRGCLLDRDRHVRLAGLSVHGDLNRHRRANRRAQGNRHIDLK